MEAASHMPQADGYNGQPDPTLRGLWVGEGHAQKWELTVCGGYEVVCPTILSLTDKLKRKINLRR
jgi:hypothetical protein